jgi:hypothetical protein
MTIAVVAERHACIRRPLQSFEDHLDRHVDQSGDQGDIEHGADHRRCPEDPSRVGVELHHHTGRGTIALLR